MSKRKLKPLPKRKHPKVVTLSQLAAEGGTTVAEVIAGTKAGIAAGLLCMADGQPGMYVTLVDTDGEIISLRMNIPEPGWPGSDTKRAYIETAAEDTRISIGAFAYLAAVTVVADDNGSFSDADVSRHLGITA
jgi:hypothetical protein